MSEHNLNISPSADVERYARENLPEKKIGEMLDSVGVFRTSITYNPQTPVEIFPWGLNAKSAIRFNPFFKAKVHNDLKDKMGCVVSGDVVVGLIVNKLYIPTSVMPDGETYTLSMVVGRVNNTKINLENPFVHQTAWSVLGLDQAVVFTPYNLKLSRSRDKSEVLMLHECLKSILFTDSGLLLLEGMHPDVIVIDKLKDPDKNKDLLPTIAKLVRNMLREKQKSEKIKIAASDPLLYDRVNLDIDYPKLIKEISGLSDDEIENV